MPKISIIVPIYNVEPYLKKCIDSILAQTLTDFELILVDDGSTDNCPAICDEYKQKDSRIIVIHKENGGQDTARNAGLDIAKGEYIGFVDSDDYINPEMYAKLYNKILECNCDMSMCTFLYVSVNGEIISQDLKYEKSQYDYPMELFNEVFPHSIMCIRLYKAALFNNLRFPNGKYYEDAMLMPYVLERCKKAVVVDEALYYYVDRPFSTMKDNISIKILDVLEVRYIKAMFMLKHHFKDQERNQLNNFWQELNIRYFLFDKKLEENKVRLKMARSLFFKLFFKLLLLPEIHFKEKMTMLVFAFSPSLYKKLFVG